MDCCISEELREQNRLNERIERMLQVENRKEFKLLLLGKFRVCFHLTFSSDQKFSQNQAKSLPIYEIPESFSYS
jgi:hypothetical protein